MESVPVSCAVAVRMCHMAEHSYAKPPVFKATSPIPGRSILGRLDRHRCRSDGVRRLPLVRQRATASEVTATGSKCYLVATRSEGERACMRRSHEARDIDPLGSRKAPGQGNGS
jgi:hypothetical protein